MADRDVWRRLLHDAANSRTDDVHFVCDMTQLTFDLYLSLKQSLLRPLRIIYNLHFYRA